MIGLGQRNESSRCARENRARSKPSADPGSTRRRLPNSVVCNGGPRVVDRPGDPTAPAPASGSPWSASRSPPFRSAWRRVGSPRSCGRPPDRGRRRAPTTRVPANRVGRPCARPMLLTSPADPEAIPTVCWPSAPTPAGEPPTSSRANGARRAHLTSTEPASAQPARRPDDAALDRAAVDDLWIRDHVVLPAERAHDQVTERAPGRRVRP